MSLWTFLTSRDWAARWRAGRIVGAFVIAIVIGLFMLGVQWLSADRATISITAPPDVIVDIDGEPIPPKSADNFARNRGPDTPLVYTFTIDAGTYTVTARSDAGAAVVRKITLTGKERFAPELEIIDEDGLVFVDP